MRVNHCAAALRETTWLAQRTSPSRVATTFLDPINWSFVVRTDKVSCLECVQLSEFQFLFIFHFAFFVRTEAGGKALLIVR